MEEKLLYGDLTYKLRGLCIKAYNELGYGLREKEYRIALRHVFLEERLLFNEELYAPFLFQGRKITSQFLDFLVEDKVVLELKVGRYPRKADFIQIKSYLAKNNIKLGLLVLFAPKGVEFYRSIISNPR